MSIYLGNNLIAPNQSNAANKSLSNLDSIGQAIIDNKTDIDASNFSTEGKAAIINMAMPYTASAGWVNLTLPASGTTITMPEDGLVCFNTAGGTIGGHIILSAGNYTYLDIASQTWQVLRASLFVKKGFNFGVTYSSTGTLNAFGYYKMGGNV